MQSVTFERSVSRALPRLLLLAALTGPTVGQTTPAPGSREAMWPAPTAEDWAKPCLVRWQRTFEDAVAVSRETKKAILICVNMDGEIASEHYAGIRYREPDTAVLYEPYVNVIASVYRHTPTDFDAAGKRVLCPRFGTVTCGEHIAIEPGLFDKFFEGERVAPRHIMIELDGAETYDVYYAFDTASVFRAIQEGITNRDIEPLPDVRGDRPLLDRVASREAGDRDAVERAYATGNIEVRRRILRRAIETQDAGATGLLRMAVFGFDLELSEMARNALAKASSPAALDLIIEALRVPMPEAERAGLIAALERIGESTPRARTLAAVHNSLGTRSASLDVEGWAKELRANYAPAPAPSWDELQASLARGDVEVETAEERIDAALGSAEASVALAVDPASAHKLSQDAGVRSKFVGLLLEDARKALMRAAEDGAGGWRLEGTLAIAEYYLGRSESAFKSATIAMDTLPAGAQNWNAMAVLAIFAEGRREAIKEAVRAKTTWPTEWMADVHDTYGVLARHPFGTEGQVVAHHDFLMWMGAFRQAEKTLEGGLERFPESWELHKRFRQKLLRRRGVEALESAYARMLAADGARPNLGWFAGYASLVAAEYRRRQGEDGAAGAAYLRAIEYYERVAKADPDTKNSVDHYVALAIAGRARIALNASELEPATDGILAAFARRPEAAASLDGLGLSPVGTAKMLHARALKSGREDLALRVQAGLDELAALDPELLELPAFERGGPKR